MLPFSVPATLRSFHYPPTNMQDDLILILLKNKITNSFQYFTLEKIFQYDSTSEARFQVIYFDENHLIHSKKCKYQLFTQLFVVIYSSDSDRRRHSCVDAFSYLKITNFSRQSATAISLNAEQVFISFAHLTTLDREKKKSSQWMHTYIHKRA